MVGRWESLHMSEISKSSSWLSFIEGIQLSLLAWFQLLTPTLTGFSSSLPCPHTLPTPRLTPTPCHRAGGRVGVES